VEQGAGPRISGALERRSWRIVAATALLFAMACTEMSLAGDPGTERTARARYLMGTRLTIECRGKVTPQVFDEAFAEVARLEGILSNWNESSELSLLNHEGFRRWIRVSDDLLSAVEVSLAWAAKTGGAFDPTVESLVRRYGLREGEDRAGLRSPAEVGRDGTAGEGTAPPPRPAVGWQHVVVDHDRRAVQFDRDGIGIDLGGIGKGIALDGAARILQERGIAGGLLDFGGQVIAVGEAPPEEGYRIGVADPARRERPVAIVTLREGSLATSGNSERAVIDEQGMTGHILDPRSGAPAPFTGSVSVLAEDGTTADALSTALFVMGRERGVEWAESRGIAALYVWRTDAGDLEFISTCAMRPGVDWVRLDPNDQSGS